MMKILTALAFVVSASAKTFPEIKNTEPGNPAPIPAHEALEKLRLPEGFQASLFASEPVVQNPIAATWDAKGRLWVAENYTYAEKQTRFDLSMNDRVIILEDKDNDGHAETRKVFTDQVQMLTSVELGRGGVWLMCPPQLLFIPDADGDDVPDGLPEVVLDGFEVAQSNYHNFASGLRWGPDGWLYGRCGGSCPGKIGLPGTPEAGRIPLRGGIWRYHPERKVAEVLCSGTTNPWGHDWDENGEMFFSNTVIGHIWHMIPGAQFKEPGDGGPNRHVYERLDQIADHYHFNTKGTWQESRDGMADDFGGGHSHIGGMVYQADQWPEKYRGKYMMLNQHGRRVNVERIERQGAGYVAKHEPDIIFSDDPWFLGIDLTTGPDGSVFILDWSDTGECHDHTGVHRTSGRIFKISYGKPSSPELALLDDLSPDGIEKILRYANVWYYRQMRILLAGKPISGDIASRLRKIADADGTTPLRLRAYTMLQAHGLLETDDISRLAKSNDEHLQVFAIRSLVDGLPIDHVDSMMMPKPGDVKEPTNTALTNFASQPASALSKLALASALQRMPSTERMDLATTLASDPTIAENPAIAHLVWIAIANAPGENLKNVLKLASISNSPELLRWAGRYFATNSGKNFEEFTKFLAQPYPPEKKIHIVRGVEEGLAGVTSAPEPDSWRAFADSIQDLPEAKPIVRKLSIIFGDTSTIEAISATVLDENASIEERQQALDILVETRAPGTLEVSEKVVSIPTLNGNALRGFALSQETSTAKLIVTNYETFLPADRSALMDLMVSRADWAEVLLEEIAAGKIPRSDLPALSARRIRDLKVESLSKKLDEAWGTLNESPEAKRKEISAWKEKLTPETLAKADLANGKQTFTMVCGACHTLNGEGGNLGPDLTGSGRDNIDYLLENIVDPSAVVGYENKVTTVEMKDGRTMAGIITGTTPETITLKLPTGESAIELSAIKSQSTSNVSIMPEGLLAILSDEQVRDLIAFLMKKD